MTYLLMVRYYNPLFKLWVEKTHRILTLQASSFSTDKVNRMGFSKFFKEKSDNMWNRGKDMIKYVLKRGGKMGTGFQVYCCTEVLLKY